MKKTIAFLGLGQMGSRMARRLLTDDYTLVVYNRTKEKASPLLEAGALWAASPAEAARQADVLFTILSTPAAVREVAMGEEGFLPQLPAGAIWIDCSTVPPAFSRAMAAEAKRHDIRFLDAPVAGTILPAEKGELIFFVGGDAHTLAEVQPLLLRMGKTVRHAGGNGQGSALKMVNNLMLGQAMAAFAEAFAFGERLGLSRDLLFSALLSSPVAAPFLAVKKEKIDQADFSPQFALQWMLKDLHQASDTAYDLGFSLPLSAATEALYGMAKQCGWGEEDFSAVYKIYQNE